MAELSCQRFVDHLGDYEDGALSTAERLEMDAHPLTCLRCSQLLADYRLTLRAARGMTSVTMPTDVRARLRRRLAQAWRARR